MFGLESVARSTLRRAYKQSGLQTTAVTPAVLAAAKARGIVKPTATQAHLSSLADVEATLRWLQERGHLVNGTGHDAATASSSSSAVGTSTSTLPANEDSGTAPVVPPDTPLSDLLTPPDSAPLDGDNNVSPPVSEDGDDNWVESSLYSSEEDRYDSSPSSCDAPLPDPEPPPSPNPAVGSGATPTSVRGDRSLSVFRGDIDGMEQFVRWMQTGTIKGGAERGRRLNHSLPHLQLSSLTAPDDERHHHVQRGGRGRRLRRHLDRAEAGVCAGQSTPRQHQEEGGATGTPLPNSDRGRQPGPGL